MNKVYIALSVVIVILGLSLAFAIYQFQSQNQIYPSPSQTSSPVPSPSTASSTPSHSETSHSPAVSESPLPSSEGPVATSTEDEYLSIYSVRLATQNVIEVNLLNSGTVNVEIDRVLVNGVVQTGMLVFSTNSSIVQARSQVTLSFDYDWTSGSSYEITVVTVNGKAITYDIEA